MTILAGSAGKTPVFRPVDWIKDLARFDPPDRDLWVGGTESRQPGQYLGHQPISRGGLKVRILSPSAASQRRTRPAALGVATGDSLVYKQFPEHETKAGHVELSAKFAS